MRRLTLGLGLTAGIPPANGAIFLSDTVSGVVAEWQATDYSGSGNLLNREAAPADSSSQSANDLVITAATFDVDKFTADGSSWFRYVTSTTFLNNLHKTTGGADHTVIFAGQVPNDATTRHIYSSGSGGSNPSVRTFFDSAETVGARQRGSANTTATSVGSTPTATDIIVIVSHDHATDLTRIKIGSATTESLAQVYSTTTTDPTGPFTIFAESDDGFPMSNGGILYGFAILNVAADASAETAIITYMETATGKDLTP